MSYTVVDDRLIEALESSEKARSEWLFLEPHPSFKGQWKVECLDSHFFFDFKDIVGPYRTVAPSNLAEFLDEADERGYEVAFFEDPGTILDVYEHLNDTPDVKLNSNFEGTVNGFLPYQVQGYNMLKDLKAGIAMWDTGTGKTVLAGALIQHHLNLENFDVAFLVVKSGNRINSQRKLKKLCGIESVATPVLKKKRLKVYDTLYGKTNQIVVCNYENFRDDLEQILPLFENQRVLCIWDEMPTKLKTRTTELYKSVKHCLFDYDYEWPGVSAKKWRPDSIHQYMLSATPIENDPEDFFNCVRLLDPTILGTVAQFRKEFVARYNYFDENKPDAWHKLDKIGHLTAHMVHQVDKTDPDIAKQFPEVIEEDFIVEWDLEHRALYNEVLDRADQLEVLPIATIALLQMVCDEPSMLTNSAAVYEAYAEAWEEWEGDEEETKEPKKQGSESAAMLIDGLDIPEVEGPKQRRLKYLLTEKHRGEKCCVFSAQNETLLPILEKRLQEWGVNYVRYAGTAKQRQAAEDAFMEDPEVQVFLSSDMGSDSLDLFEGSVVIHYNLPWKWSTKIQRQNRINRASSTHALNLVYTLMMDTSIEYRKKKVIGQKYVYHKGVFKGAIADQSTSARMTLEDLYYMLGHGDR